MIPPYPTAKEQLSLREKVGQFLMPAVFLDDTEEQIQAMEALIQGLGIGSLCFFQSRALAAANVQAQKQTGASPNEQPDYFGRLTELITRYQKVSKYPLLISIDAEWGLSMRLPDQLKWPYPITLGALGNRIDLIEQVGYAIGLECKKAGVHWNLAPVVDINTQALNPVIGYRSFGDRPEAVSQRALAWTKGLSKAGVLNSLKHFPGHGDTRTDSHLDLPVIDKTKDQLEAEEWIPFRHLIGQADSLMLGHLAVPALTMGVNEPATLSPALIQIIRDWGYQGILISDALNMKSVSRRFEKAGALELAAFQAGCDVLCFSEQPEAGIEAIIAQAKEEEIEQRFQRWWALKEKGLRSVEEISSSTTSTVLLNEIAENTLTLLIGSPQSLQAFKKKQPSVRVFGKSSGIFQGDSSSTHCLIELYLPSPKPGKNFGLREEEWKELLELLQTQKCWLYLFGNPYALSRLPWKACEGVVLAYEQGVAFQEAALKHYLGQLSARGQSPVNLKNDD